VGTAKAVDVKAIEAAPVPALDLHDRGPADALTSDPKAVAQPVSLPPGAESLE
jgi:hypothetical protein